MEFSSFSCHFEFGFGLDLQYESRAGGCQSSEFCQVATIIISTERDPPKFEFDTGDPSPWNVKEISAKEPDCDLNCRGLTPQ